MSKNEFRFVIDAFTPDTIPMARFADYICNLAKLMGSDHNVHFDRIEKGSLVLVARTDDQEALEIKTRLHEVSNGDGPKEARQAYRTLDDMLAKDNAVGRILTNGNLEGAQIIEFPGRERRLPVNYGTISQQGSIDGIIIRIGGVDATVPVHIRDGNAIYHCNTTVELAKRLSVHYLDTPIRVRGVGQWYRETSGAWVMKAFKISDYEVLDNSDLQDIVDRLQKTQGSEWHTLADPFAELQAIRHGEGEPN